MSFTNTAPFEVIAAPYKLYSAPVGTAFPAVGVAPANPWALIGTSGDLNYDRGTGVMVEHKQTTSPWRSVGDAGSRKIFRTEEDLIVKLKLVDITLEQYAHALNSNDVDVSTPGQRSIGLSRGFAVATHALLIRGEVSPYGDGENMQYEVPRAAQTGSPSVSLAKQGEPAGLDLEWMALVDPNAASEDTRFGQIVVEDASIT